MMNNTNELTTQLDRDLMAALIESLVTNLPTDLLGQEVQLYEDGAIEEVSVNGARKNATAFHFVVGDRTFRVAIQPVLRSRVKAQLEH